MSRKPHVVSIDPALTDPAEDEVLLLDTVLDEVEESPLAEADDASEWLDSENMPPAALREWMVPALAGLAVAAWTAFFVWAHRMQGNRMVMPEAWIEWIGQWSMPVLLIGLAWLLAMRTSRREAARFGDVTRTLSAESGRLETRLARINSELSIAREFIAAQSRDLEALGRIAAERLSENAGRLESLIGENGQKVEAIASVSSSALDNMEKLRGQLPVITNSARDVTNQIGNAGRTAHSQLQELMQGFKRLNEFGVASEQHVTQLREEVGLALAEFTSRAERFDEISRDSFAGLAATTAEYHERLERNHKESVEAMRKQSRTLLAELDNNREGMRGHEEAALDTFRKRLGAIERDYETFADRMANSEASAIEQWRGSIGRIEAELGQALATLEETDRQAMDKARARLAELIAESERLDSYIDERNQLFSDEMARRAAESDELEQANIARMHDRLVELDRFSADHAHRQQVHADAIGSHGDALAARIDDLQRRIDDLAAHGTDATTALSRAIHILDDNLAVSRAVLGTADQEIAAATDSSVRLLELLQASVQQGQTSLPEALNSGEELLRSFERRMTDLQRTVEAATEQGKALAAYTEAAADRIDSGQDRLQQLNSGLESNESRHTALLEKLSTALSDLEQRQSSLIVGSEAELGAAMAALGQSADTAANAIRRQSEETLATLSGSVETEVKAALDRAISERLDDVAEKLEEASRRAASNGREAMVQLRDNLAKVNELAGNLEQRVSLARRRAEEDVDNDFARRVALITETLNSNAIDIVRAIDSDVSDTAWTSYLKGDRGIFTRRAVKLLDTGVARPIAQLFQNDPDFREQVSRYIHDFEAMLRQVLSTRDGNAMGVTLLSSDMGKLYVALAQAIERLRS